MKTLPLGHANVPVSALCLGTMHLGDPVPQADAFALLDQYAEAGGSFLDTANIYAFWRDGNQGGTSELRLGEWMRARGNRDDMFLASKCGIGYADVEAGLRAEQIVSECEKSLQRLGVETIDLFYAHEDDRETPLDETMEAFTRLVSAGKVRHLGASNYTAWRLMEAEASSARAGGPAFTVLQQQATFLQPRIEAWDRVRPSRIPLSVEHCDYARRRNIGLVAYSPLLRGAYTGRDDRPVPDRFLGTETDRRLAALREVASQLDATPNQVVLAWMLHSDPPIIPLFGASSLKQMKEAVGALDLTLSDEQVKLLNG